MVRTIPGLVALVAFAGQKVCVPRAWKELGCSGCSLSSLTDVYQKAVPAWTSCVPSPVAWTVAALLAEEDIRKLWYL